MWRMVKVCFQFGVSWLLRVVSRFKALGLWFGSHSLQEYWGADGLVIWEYQGEAGFNEKGGLYGELHWREKRWRALLWGSGEGKMTEGLKEVWKAEREAGRGVLGWCEGTSWEEGDTSNTKRSIGQGRGRILGPSYMVGWQRVSFIISFTKQHIMRALIPRQIFQGIACVYVLVLVYSFVGVYVSKFNGCFKQIVMEASWTKPLENYITCGSFLVVYGFLCAFLFVYLFVHLVVAWSFCLFTPRFLIPEGATHTSPYLYNGTLYALQKGDGCYLIALSMESGKDTDSAAC